VTSVRVPGREGGDYPSTRSRRGDYPPHSYTSIPPSNFERGLRTTDPDRDRSSQPSRATRLTQLTVPPNTPSSEARPGPSHGPAVESAPSRSGSSPPSPTVPAVASGADTDGPDPSSLRSPPADSAVARNEDPTAPRRARSVAGSDGTTATLSLDSRAAAVGGLLAALLAGTLLRAYDYATVIRPWGVVPPENDPHVYLWHVERAVRTAGGDPVGAATAAATAADLDHLFLAVLAAFAALLPDPHVAVVWYPVLAAVIGTVLAYALATRATGDRTAGVAAALLLAVVPAHATRTRVGFADHHAFDYLLLTAAALALAVALSAGRSSPDPDGTATGTGSGRGHPVGAGVLPDRDAGGRPAPRAVGRRQYLAGVAVGLLVAAQLLAWRGGIALVVPLAVATVAATLSAARRRSPLDAATPALLGLLIAAFVAGAAAELLGWGVSGASTAVVALLGVAFVVALAAEAATRAALRPRWTAAVGLAGLAVAAALAWIAIPEVGALWDAAAAYLAGTADGSVAETVSLFGGPFGLVTGPVALMGLVAPFAAVGAAIVARELRRRDDPALVVLLTYAATLFVYAAVQRRFVGELAPFAAGLAAVGLLATLRYLLRDAPRGSGSAERSTGAVTDRADDPDGRQPAARTPRSRGRSALAAALAVFLVVATATAGAAGVAAGAAQAAADESWVETGRWVAGIVVAEDRSYPDSYVLTPWAETRRVNYLVGDPTLPSLGYENARATYDPLVAAADPDVRYPFVADRVGFLAVRPVGQASLQGPDGSGTATGRDPAVSAAGPAPASRVAVAPLTVATGLPDLGHYRLVHDPAGGNRVYEVVPGATVVVPLDRAAAVGPTVTADGVRVVRPAQRPVATATVTVEGEPRPYRRTADPTADGWVIATVAYPGVYDLAGTRAVVTEVDVREGRFVGPADARPSPVSTWRFGEGVGAIEPVAVDATGGFHGRLVGDATRTVAGTDGALRLNGAGAVVVPGDPLAGAGAARVAVTFRTAGPLGETDRPRLVAAGDTTTYPRTVGYQVGLDGGQLVAAVGGGAETTVLRGPAVDDGDWHTAALQWDGATVTLAVDGRVVESRSWTGPVASDGEVVFGADHPGNRQFVGEIADVTLTRGETRDRSSR
jgi:dolichyl-diphosphooligosaccharide--protein glycosyltransferase